MTRREALRMSAFLLLCLLLLVAVSYAVRMNGGVKDRFVGFYAEKRDTLDAVVIGSSPVYPAFATPMLYGEEGIALYPLSSNMQRPVAGLWLTREALAYQSPRLMIYEMRMYTARDEDLLGNMAHTREVTDNLRYSANRLRTIGAMVEDRSEWKTYIFDIFKYHSNWKTLVLPSQLRTCFYAWPEPRKGHELYDEVGPAEVPDATAAPDVGEAAEELAESGFERLPIPEEQEVHLRQLFSFLKERGQDALFLVTPHTTRTAETDAMYRYLEDLVTAEGYPFLDLNRTETSALGIDPRTDYRDYGNHLNAVGARKLTAWLGPWLRSRYELPDHRGDKRYASWDAAYTRWQGEYAEAERTIARHIREESWYEIPEEE